VNIPLIPKRYHVCSLHSNDKSDTNSARAKIIAALILFPMRCHSVGCGTSKSRAQLATRRFRSRSHDAVIRAYDDAGNVIETHEHAGDFKAW
jgi:hypothetical protein